MFLASWLPKFFITTAPPPTNTIGVVFKLYPNSRIEVIKLLGGVISGMNVGQPVIMQAANSEAQELTEDVMDDADVAGLAMGWMSKGD
jgi:hypothetical protein